MELKSLVLGLVMSMGAFALKSGAGMGYLMADGRKWPVQAGRTLAFAAGYGAVFLLSWGILSHVDLTAHLADFTLLFKSGMTLHLILAVLVMAWGAGLLGAAGKGGDEGQIPGPPDAQPSNARPTKAWPSRARPSRAWMALAVPCPVCFAVILLSSGFLAALYPGQTRVFIWLYLGFVSSAIGAALLVSRAARGRAENLLGTIMVYISGYFILSVLLVPQWADLGRIYRISLSHSVGAAGPAVSWAGLVILILLAFCLGFFRAPEKELI
ncbi:MAG: hypothetical protein HUN04_15450 [Desulfobacter sp.]|nr:MAG: hypothetical protein HUN04_15450 [Desulfobacter sp.]